MIKSKGSQTKYKCVTLFFWPGSACSYVIFFDKLICFKYFKSNQGYVNKIMWSEGELSLFWNIKSLKNLLVLMSSFGFLETNVFHGY